LRKNETADGARHLHKALPFRAQAAHNAVSMQIHASCAAREGHGVLLLGPPGSGKSDLLLRLFDYGFVLVADDRVDIRDGIARAPAALAGLLEVRGLGLMRLTHDPQAPVSLAVTLGRGERLPQPETYPPLGVPLVRIDPQACSAPRRVVLALDCAIGRATQLAGAFA
jgi:HPr kinase/phosphorylase